VVPHEQLYPRNGLQYLPFNTLYQLAAEPPDRLRAASAVLLIPDLIAYWLTGSARAEVTNASTTGLLDVRTRAWDTELADRLGIPPAVLPQLIQPGEVIGPLLPHLARATGLPPSTPVIAVGSHDTASAVVAVPAAGDRFAFISSGTWSLVGLELPEPVLSEESRLANFTNEGGVDGTIRYLRNVMGLWMLSETLRNWELQGSAVRLGEILAAAAEVPDGGPVVDADDLAFLPPGDMPSRIEEACRNSGQPVPQGRPALARCILDSLAAAYARAIDNATTLAGREVDVVHVVGGGARNQLLCRLTSAATGRPVIAGPVEATALGNALVQARAVGTVSGGIDQLRTLAGERGRLEQARPT
jgi:rhamnulokinase